MTDILEKILATKREEVRALRQTTTREALERQAREQPPPRGFARALAARVAAGRPAVIAEIKKASPSRGVIRADFDPAWLAADYALGGAACLSVLTDRQYFQGSNEALAQARAACALPTLRKDFLIDELQVLEARAIGADCVLLIAAALSARELGALAAAAQALGMDVLVEVHDAGELGRAMQAELEAPVLLGINNRNLRSFATRLETTLELLPRVPSGWDVVTESGIAGAADVARLRAAGVQRFLVGESLMRAPRPGAALQDLIRT